VHFNVPPHPFANVSPHCFGKSAHVLSVGQLQVPGVLAAVLLHTLPVPEQPQSSLPPQPSSSCVPHLPE
jgi:hypothetical protein